jgi:signal transduction histidine kinase
MRPLFAGGVSVDLRRTTEGAIFLVTLLVIVFFSGLILQTTELLCQNDGARQFLERVKSVPLEPWKIPAIALLLFAALAVSSLLRQRLGDRLMAQVVLSLGDLLLSVGIITVLDFSYRGILFIAIINAIRFIPEIRMRYGLVALAVLTYVLADYDIVSMRFPVFSITDYMDYYRESQRFLFYGARNLLISLNDILFIFFLVLEIQLRIEENRRTRDLNLQLVKTSETLRLANVQLAEYARRSEQTARIKERNRLAREVHDIVGHALTGIDLGLKACLEVFNRDPARVRSQLEKISTLAHAGVEDIRRSVHELKADQDEGHGFLEALGALAQGIRECTGAEIQVRAQGTPSLPWSPLVEEALYRVAQEALTNAIRHGEADRVELAVRFEPGWVELAVGDNGKGCEDLVEGFGLQNMRERAAALGGRARFQSQAPGFRVTVAIPMRPGLAATEAEELR